MSGQLPRTIRLDLSDVAVFAHAAEPGEWAVTGTFLFSGRDAEAMERPERIAFRTGFLGIESWGYSTFVVVSRASAVERRAAVEALAAQFVARLGAPDLAAARPAAAAEIAFAAELCLGHSVGALLGLVRDADADGGLRERFRVFRSDTPPEVLIAAAEGRPQ